MTITLELTHKQESLLKKRAAKYGLDLESYLLEIASAQTMKPANELSIEEFCGLLHEAALPGPGLPDAALTSEGIYREHP